MRRLMTWAVLALPLLAAAQTEAPGSREKAQLRRVQAAMQGLQGQLEQAQTEKAALLREKTSAAEELQRQRGGTKSAQAQRDQALAQVEQLRQQLGVAAASRQADEAQAAQREAQLQQQLTQARADSAELRQSNASLAALLERKTQSLAAAEDKNRELHGLAMLAVERWLNNPEGEATARRSTMLGVEQVRLEDSAEALRARIDAQRLPPQ